MVFNLPNLKVVFAGMLGFGSVWGKMADKYGRWPTLWTVQFLLGWFGVLSAFSPTYYWLLFLRMMVGACVVGTGQRFEKLNNARMAI